MAEPHHLAHVGDIGTQVRLLPIAAENDLPLDSLAGAQIVVVQVDPGLPASLDRFDKLQFHFPEISVIAAIEKLDIAASRALMRRGIDDLVSLPIDQQELVSVLTEIATRKAETRGSSARLAPTLAIMKSTGGCGATTLATHLTAALATEIGGEARGCLIDCDLQSGDAAAYLGCSPRLSLADLLDPQAAVDGELMKSVTCRANDLVDVIAAPREIMPIEALEFSRLIEIVSLAQQQYAIVVVDLPGALANWALSLAFAADRVVHVTTLSVSALRHTKRQIDFLKSMGLQRDRLDVIANRAEKRLFKTIDAEAAGQALDHRVLASVGEEGRSLSQAQDEGVLINSIQRRTRFMKDIGSAAKLIIHGLNGER
ncbi:hypothetical protein G7A66_02350 [Altererythrobacter sp. SALINAS58]|uniref:AAA family ATPase n=1 Tax=Alteripontixanthobacter muriae TaxID=2705546 RepID=UPI001576C592|nr:AAA family ATPase [Alteripontixanthobacter muriae]NTZ41951.1 hypothetical protein [Alteripontixanthobacter muriae]